MSSVKTRGQCTLAGDWGQCYSLDHDCDLVPAGLLVYWTVNDLVPAGCPVFNTGVLRQVPDFWRGKFTSSTTPGHLPPGLVMGPNWVIHYKVVLSSWRQLTSFSLWEGVRFWGIFFVWENIFVVVGLNFHGWFISYLHFSILWLFLLIFIQ